MIFAAKADTSFGNCADCIGAGEKFRMVERLNERVGWGIGMPSLHVGGDCIIRSRKDLRDRGGRPQVYICCVLM